MLKKSRFGLLVIISGSAMMAAYPAYASMLSDVQSGKTSVFPYIVAVGGLIIFAMMIMATRGKKQSKKLIDGYETHLDEFRRSIRAGKKVNKR